MRPKPHLDPEFGPLPKARSWCALPRSLNRLMILIAILGVALAAYAERSRPRHAPMKAFPAALQPPGVRLPQPMTRPRDPSVKIARPGIDEAMIHTARQGIDEGMIVNPSRMATVRIWTVPQPAPGVPGAPPDSAKPEPWTPQR